jgi:hypothetical protein
MAAIAARDFKPKCVQSRKSGKLMLQGYELQEIPEVCSLIRDFLINLVKLQP